MLHNNKGFTLVELMITLAMTGIIIAAVYSTYTVQQRAYGKQEQIMEIQQNLRAVIHGMAQDIRMAGYDPTGKANSGFSEAKVTSLGFSMDYNGNGDNTNDPGEEITYTLDGTTLRRGTQPLANNIEKIEFLYNKGTSSQSTNMSGNLDAIRSVTISLVGRAKNRDASYMDEHDADKPYEFASGDTWYPPTAGDKHYRRQILTITVQCRNMGLSR